MIRMGTPEDGVTVAALATQVFLDTYATEGIRPDLAREAFEEYSADRFVQRLGDPDRLLLLAERDTHLQGFAELSLHAKPPREQADPGLELIRLYIQPAFQRLGLGSMLLQRVEACCVSRGAVSLWLTAWSGNCHALLFYLSRGYEDVGVTSFTFEDRSYENRILLKTLRSV